MIWGKVTNRELIHVRPEKKAKYARFGDVDSIIYAGCACPLKIAVKTPGGYEGCIVRWNLVRDDSYQKLKTEDEKSSHIQDFVKELQGQYEFEQCVNYTVEATGEQVSTVLVLYHELNQNRQNGVDLYGELVELVEKSIDYEAKKYHKPRRVEKKRAKFKTKFDKIKQSANIDLELIVTSIARRAEFRQDSFL
ncbi:hypothetical protein HN587_02030 [Candidatus Woesearchaeota archaeon]|jgi:hypothetical protein|nr:hypothetical protein [Candidatus Woesearchaeota archaeon]